MKGNRIVIMAIVVIVLLAGAWWLFSRGRSAPGLDLTTMLEAAEKRPDGNGFSVIEADLNGETKRAIAVPIESRLTFKVQVPDNGWLRVSVGTRPESWTQDGNGSLFFVGVSDGRTFDELFTQHVNPFGNPGDRKWIPVWVDLSAYAGEEVSLVFNTRTSPAKQEPDPRHDAPLWGAPEIIIR